MEKNLPVLYKGDLIGLVAPAKSINESSVVFAKEFFENAGFRVIISPHCLGEHHYFSGTEAERLSDFQWALDHPEIKAIVCARGGYGCLQIVDKINWAGQLDQPKWIVGFSDVTVFHQRMQRFGIPSIHGTMPLNFKDNSSEALETLIAAMQGTPLPIHWESNPHSIAGNASGKVVGGNLSILFGLLGTDDQIDFKNTILFIEDLAEHLYHIDRMFYAFSKAGILDQISGLLVGGMTDLKDTAVPFGKIYQEIILSHFTYRKIPIAFDFPAGHISDNRALILGNESTLSISSTGCSLT